MNRQRVKERLPEPVMVAVREVYGRLRPDYYPFKSWSQGGEDMILRELLAKGPSGFYVDVGAFHPKFGSNTYALYRRGWRGINIDARPGSMAPFRRSRRRDVNLEVAIGTEPGTADFYVFVEDELSSLDKAWAEEKVATGHALRKTVVQQVERLADVLAGYDVPRNFDLLNVDCEGRDADVLKSNDWRAWCPGTVIVECSHGAVEAALQSEAALVLSAEGYRAVAATWLSVVFQRL